MLYHSYQYLDEARLCYEVARERHPEDFRWIYYLAKLEKAAFRYEAAESLFRRALEMKPDDPELWAELGELYLQWARRADAEVHLAKAVELDPLEPTAALGRARLLTIEERWEEVVLLLSPLLDRYPRLSAAHRYLAAAYGGLGREEERELHQEKGEYGSAVESPLMRKLHDLAVPAILEGDPSNGPELIQKKCVRCHDPDRMHDFEEDRRWWARTVRRMQRQAGWDWLTDDEAAALVAHLATR